jgi:hypothetical protein
MDALLGGYISIWRVNGGEETLYILYEQVVEDEDSYNAKQQLSTAEELKPFLQLIHPRDPARQLPPQYMVGMGMCIALKRGGFLQGLLARSVQNNDSVKFFGAASDGPDWIWPDENTRWPTGSREVYRPDGE